MLDSFEILSTSGVVLWSKTYVPVGANVVNSLIKDVFIEGRSASAKSEGQGPKPTYRKDGYTLKWASAKDLGLIFVVCLDHTDCWKTVAGSMSECCIGSLPISPSPLMDR